MAMSKQPVHRGSAVKFADASAIDELARLFADEILRKVSRASARGEGKHLAESSVRDHRERAGAGNE